MEAWLNPAFHAASLAKHALVAVAFVACLGIPPAFAARKGAAAPSSSAAKAAILRIALTIAPDIPFASASIAGMGQDARGRWWVQGRTQARAGFAGEPTEQWFVVWDGREWTYHDHGTGIERADIADVRRWREPPKDAPRTDTLITPQYLVLIDWRCPEGSVSCDDVRYTGTSRKTGATLTLKGRSVHTACRGEPETPCRFIGYVFDKGGTRYFVGDDGTLQVTRHQRVLLEERGRWDYD